MLPDYIRGLLTTALEGTPAVIQRMLAGLAPEDAMWDFRPDPTRFTLREIVAHLADWEIAVSERLTRTRDEERPFLPNWDEEQKAVEGDYEHSDSGASLRALRVRREHTVALLRALPNEAWLRVAEREFAGEMT